MLKYYRVYTNAYYIYMYICIRILVHYVNMCVSDSNVSLSSSMSTALREVLFGHSVDDGSQQTKSALSRAEPRQAVPGRFSQSMDRPFNHLSRTVKDPPGLHGPHQSELSAHLNNRCGSSEWARYTMKIIDRLRIVDVGQNVYFNITTYMLLKVYILYMF